MGCYDIHTGNFHFLLLVVLALINNYKKQDNCFVKYKSMLAARSVRMVTIPSTFYRGGYRGEGGAPPPSLGPKEKKSPTDIAYDCRGISGSTSTSCGK